MMGSIYCIYNANLVFVFFLKEKNSQQLTASFIIRDDLLKMRSCLVKFRANIVFGGFSRGVLIMMNIQPTAKFKLSVTQMVTDSTGDQKCSRN